MSKACDWEPREQQEWDQIEKGYRWVHQAARILKNEAGLNERQVRRRFHGLLGAIRRHNPRDKVTFTAAMGHFLKVTDSYLDGLFHCYAIGDLPRTNNDLEHLFGSSRHHERRATGRRSASPAMVLRGPVRLIAAAATRLRQIDPAALIPHDLAAWRKMRAALDQRHQARRMRHRFRKNPDAYLRSLEAELLKPTLPS